MGTFNLTLQLGVGEELEVEFIVANDIINMVPNEATVKAQKNKLWKVYLMHLFTFYNKQVMSKERSFSKFCDKLWQINQTQGRCHENTQCVAGWLEVQMKI